MPDYPPVANAGQDVILYLPHNNVTLNGSLSSDDKVIVNWEWTKSPSDQDKAVDMQKTRTPYLELSNLEEGMYTFILKVTDEADQFDTSTVHVFVKPPTNKPPTANAGKNMTVSLPQTTVLLDGSKSSDDIKIVSWNWEMVRCSKTKTFVIKITSVDCTRPGRGHTDSWAPGCLLRSYLVKVIVWLAVTAPATVITPNYILNATNHFTKLCGPGKVEFSAKNESVTNVTSLTKGQYIFKLTVTDGNGNIAANTVSVTVTQNSNSPPKANAGGDHTVELPVDVLVLNGTQSRDDLAIAKWLWTREPTSLAIGSIIAGTDTSPVLMSLFKVCDAVIKHITIGRNAVSTPIKSSNRTVVAVENIFLDLVPAGTKRDILLRSSGESITPLISLCRKTISNILLLHSSVGRRNSCSSAGTETSR
ncbi:hypothetical protein J6590_040638 [Homalodisca vitripennis]|nr:hypothetical protein J6590_040638 [Homalodisca vitripennis]